MAAALRRLGMGGTVELVPNRGAIARASSRSELINLFRIREFVEGLAVRLAAEEAAYKGSMRTRLPAHRRQRERPVQVFRNENGAFQDLIPQIGDTAQLALMRKRLQ